MMMSATIAFSDNFSDHPCAYQDHYYASLGGSPEQQYLYEEVETGPLSSAWFSYWENGRKIWSAQAERLCTSAGVSFCGVTLPFPAGEDLVTQIDAPMTAFQTKDGRDFVVFAHLWENSYDELRYFYQHRGFPFMGTFIGDDADDRDQFALPNVFERRHCLFS
jgi:hypothetical protein